ncbi:integrase catalytic domain-containing protein, partial [Arthrobacter rhombi]
MKQGISMGARREITRAMAKAYLEGTKGQKGVLLDNLCTAMGWSRANARRQLVAAANRKAGLVPLPKRRARKY